MTKPKPLDLEELRKNVRKIFIDKEKFRYLGNSVRRRIDHEYGFLHALSLIEQRLKSACEFWLRYRDSPELFVEEYPEYTELLNQEFGYIKETKKEIVIKRFNYYLYNEWLFKLAFNFPALTEGRQQPTSHENSKWDSPMKAQTHAPLRRGVACPSAKRGVEAEPQQALKRGL